MNSSEVIKLAQIAALSQRIKSTAQGEPPTADELASLLDGKLAFSRKQEVYSHLNRNPEAFSQWIALVEARHNASGEKAEAPSVLTRISDAVSSLFDSVYAVPGLAAVLVAVVLLAYIPVSNDSDDQWQTLTNEFGDTSSVKTEQRLHSFLKAVADDCENLMAEQSHRTEYQQVLVLFEQQLGSESAVDLTPDDKVFDDAQSTCQFNKSLLSSIDD